MKEKMNVLFIAPFEMQEQILKIAESYPDIVIDVQLGNESVGKKLAMEAITLNYDCIISRGNTARLIRQAVSIPVVEVQVSLGDVLRTLADTAQIPPVIAAVGYHSVVDSMGDLNPYLPFRLHTAGFDRTEELPEIFQDLRSQGIHTMLCDAIAYQFASREGFDAYILRSCEDSIRYAFEEVMLLLRSLRSTLEENQLLRLLNTLNHESETVVFSHDHRLYYSSLSEEDASILLYLQDHLPDFSQNDRFKLIKHQSGYQYRISARKVILGARFYYAYFVSRKIPDMQGGHKGIRYVTCEELRREMDGSVFRIANLENYYSTELNQAMTHKNPVLIFGEVGVGKNHLAEMIYLNSRYTNNPFVFIDFTLINKQTWNFLINKNDSPLCDNSNTLFLKNIDALDMDRLNQLLAAVTESEATKRNRILISCSVREGLTAPYLQKTMYQLSCIPIQMLPLRGQYGTIENSVKYLLSHFRSVDGIPAGDPEPAAMSMLLHYAWPQNFLQLIRVVHKVAILAGNGPITRQIVTDALTTEMYLTQAETDQSANATLDLSKPLSEINADIIRILLEQKGGNQTLTAKSLGISRTTMWRMLKSNQMQGTEN